MSKKVVESRPKIYSIVGKDDYFQRTRRGYEFVGGNNFSSTVEGLRAKEDDIIMVSSWYEFITTGESVPIVLDSTPHIIPPCQSRDECKVDTFTKNGEEIPVFDEFGEFIEREGFPPVKGGMVW